MIELLKTKTPLIMGIVNVTPDSFSDGEKFYKAENAIAHGLELVKQGAHILDIGGESTRPGAEIITPEEEMERVLPVIKGLKGKAPLISIDTRNAKTMDAAIKAGANFINDVSAFTHDPDSLGVAEKSGLPICLMHMKGTPQDMQKNPFYEDVVEEVMIFFEERIAACIKAGIHKENIILDVGIGFGKSIIHNLELLKNLKKFHRFGCPLLLGVSRKSFIVTLTRQDPKEDRLAGSLAAALWGVSEDIRIIRVHDVKETAQAFAVYQAINAA